MLFHLANIFQDKSRSGRLKIDIIGSVALKGMSVVLSLLIVPLTIDYVNPTQYGIWLTLSSLVSWIVFFDAGLTLGFRNKFGEAIAKDKHLLARVYVSNTYYVLGLICTIILITVFVGGGYVNWASMLGVESSYQNELSKVFSLLVIFFSFQLVFQTMSTILVADQKVMWSSLINVIGQMLTLIVIFILSRMKQHGDLIDLVWVVSGMPVIVLFWASLLLFAKRYRAYRPTFRFFRFRYVKDVLGTGYKFFIITTAMLFIFQLMNVIISKSLGPDAVTEYNIAYKYYNVFFMFLTLVLNPIWTAFTNAFSNKDYDWMRSTLRRIDRFAWGILGGLGIMFVISKLFYKIWIGDSVSVPVGVNISVAIYMMIMSVANVYMYLVNGIGKVGLQLYIYLAFAIIAYPSMNYLCGKYGISGLLIVPSIVYVIQACLLKIQVNRIIRGKASGIWNH